MGKVEQGLQGKKKSAQGPNRLAWQGGVGFFCSLETIEEKRMRHIKEEGGRTSVRTDRQPDPGVESINNTMF